MRRFSNILRITLFMLLLVLILGVSSYAASFRKIEYKAMLGDLDGDKKISYADNRLMSRYLSGLEKFNLEQQVNADIDNDGRITSADARLLSRRELGVRRIKFVPGDLNNDNKMDSADVRLLQRYFAGLEKLNIKQQLIADVDGDNRVTTADLRLMNRRMVNIIKVFPIEGDITGNGTLSKTDSNNVLKASVGSLKLNDAMKRCADVDCDGKVTSADSRIILRRAQGLE